MNDRNQLALSIGCQTLCDTVLLVPAWPVDTLWVKCDHRLGNTCQPVEVWRASHAWSWSTWWL